MLDADRELDAAVLEPGDVVHAPGARVACRRRRRATDAAPSAPSATDRRAGVLDALDPLHAATHASTNDAPTATMPISEPLPRHPLAEEQDQRRTTTAGISGMSHAWSSTITLSPSAGRRRRGRATARLR